MPRRDSNRGLREQPRSMPTTDAYRSNYDAIFKKVPDAPAADDPAEGTHPQDIAPGRLPRRG